MLMLNSFTPRVIEMVLRDFYVPVRVDCNFTRIMLLFKSIIQFLVSCWINCELYCLR